MRKWIIGIITTIVLAIVVIFYFVLNNRESNILDKVPANAASVMVIDLKGLTAKLLFDELTSSEKSTDKLAELVPDSLIDIDWSKSGINLMDKAVIFSSYSALNDPIGLHLILPLSSVAELNTFVDSLGSKINLERSQSGTIYSAYSPKYRILISWNKNYVVATFLSENQLHSAKFQIDVLSSDGKNSILQDSSFTGNLRTDFDIIAYTSNLEVYSKKMNRFWSDNIKSVCSFFHFNDGELAVEMKIEPKQNGLLDQLFDQPKNKIARIEKSDTSFMAIDLHINPFSFFKIIDQTSSIKFNKEKISLLLAWDGRASFIVNKDKTIEYEYISYDYDDNFNKIEVRKKEFENVSDIQLHLGVNQKILDSISEKNPVARHKKDTLLFKGSNYLIKKAGNEFLCYSKYSDPPKLSTEKSPGNISVSVNYKGFMQILKNNKLVGDSSTFSLIPIKRIEFNVYKKDEIVIKSKFYFINNKKNALFSIAENFE